MKKFLLLLLVLALVGCSTRHYRNPRFDKYSEYPESIFKDPHFAEYQKNAEEVEKEYLHGEIGFVEYRERKTQLDEDYEREVQARDAIIRGE